MMVSDAGWFDVVVSTISQTPSGILQTLIDSAVANVAEIVKSCIIALGGYIAWILRWKILPKVPWLMRKFVRKWFDSQVVNAEKEIKENGERFKRVSSNFRARSRFLSAITDELIQGFVETALKRTSHIREELNKPASQ